MKRNKEEMEQMKSLVNSYLIANKNDPHAAHNDYIKYFLVNNIMLPYYINGIKDFIKLSKNIKDNEYLQLIDKSEQKENNSSSEDRIKEYLNNVTFKEVKEIYNIKKSIVTGSAKDILVYLYISKSNNEFNIKEYTNSDLHYLKDILKEYL